MMAPRSFLVAFNSNLVFSWMSLLLWTSLYFVVSFLPFFFVLRSIDTSLF